MESGLRDKIEQCRILLVGAGGIGCEVLKNLTLTGFKNIDAIDLDTIDVSNLNRQFLFNKSNVGQSKSEVAISIAKREYAASENGLNLRAIHKSITLAEFDVDFFKQYTFVINALDNRAARSHVNRMCLAAEIPLLESGTAGYTGQAKLIKNGLTSCYECDGIQKEGRTYAACTIRNTPSQPIHCIVWAKHLFHQLFGEEDPDNDVSPQTEQLQSNGDNHTNNGSSQNTNNHSDPTSPTNKPLSTRAWAKQHDYDPILLFEKLFNHDINYLLSMENLWKDRTKPSPLIYKDLIQDSASTSSESNGFKLGNQILWTLKECVEVFSKTVDKLNKRMISSGFQHWDKDDVTALNFVVAASNLRCKCFSIERKSPFDVKSLAGNIIPAISSTNSVIGGLLVLQAIRLLKSIPIGTDYRKLEDPERNEMMKYSGRTSYLNYTSRKDLISSYECPPPNADCLGCSRGKIPEVQIHLSMKNTTLADLVDKIIIGTFHFVCPDLSLDDDSGIIIWSKDEESDDDSAVTEKARQRLLLDIPHLKSPKTRLMVSDLLQDKQISMVLIDEELDEEKHNNFFYAQMNGSEV